MRMFRGEGVKAWQARLVDLGWPELAAEDMAHFLVHDPTQKAPPRWSNLLAADPGFRQLALADVDVEAVFDAAIEREGRMRR